jgi:hypothetical protein
MRPGQEIRIRGSKKPVVWVFPVECVILENRGVNRGWLSTPTKQGSIEKNLVRLPPSGQVRTMDGLRED